MRQGAAGAVVAALTPAVALRAWTLDPAAVVVALLLVAGQLWLVHRARRRGRRWPWWRAALGAALGPGALVLASCSFLAVYRRVAFWPGALASAVLLVVVPVGLALGDPLRLLRLAGVLRPHPAHHDDDRGRRRALGGVLAVPTVGALAGVALQLALFLSPWWTATLRSGAVRSATGLALVAVGALFALPVFAADGGAGSGAAGLRVLLAFLDGVVDAVPGLVVGVNGTAVAGGWYAAHRLPGSMTTGQDQLLGGTLSAVVAEVVAVPLLLRACRRWAAADAVQAAREDALLDALDREQRRPG